MGALLASAGWAGASVTPLAGDASSRRYFRAIIADKSSVIMDCSSQPSATMDSFVTLARALHSFGYSAPEILAADRDVGLMLIEDLGDDLLPRVIARAPGTEAPLYRLAAAFLADLHRQVPPANLAPIPPETFAHMPALALSYYRTGSPEADPDLEAELAGHLNTALAALPQRDAVIVLRDFHAENLIDLPGRDGLRRLGLLDFQDAFLGHPAYDLASLLQDARRDLSPGIAAETAAYFAELKGWCGEETDLALATLGTQRNLRILGVFARLAIDAGKPKYLDLIPRVWGHVEANLSHPALGALRSFVETVLPRPTDGHLNRLRPS